MGDVVVFKTAQHVCDGIDFANVGQELVAEAFALGGAAHEPGDVDKGDARRNDFLGPCDLTDCIEARIRNGNFARIRLDGAERIVGSLCSCRLGERVEECGLADIRQSDNAALETHGSSLSVGLETLQR